MSIVPLPSYSLAILTQGLIYLFFMVGKTMSCCAKTAEPIKMAFGLQTRVGRRSHVLDGGGVEIPP